VSEVLSCGQEEQVVENSRSDSWPPQPRSAPGHSAGGNDEKNQEKIALGWSHHAGKYYVYRISDIICNNHNYNPAIRCM
jgi:hypothetical protein